MNLELKLLGPRSFASGGQGIKISRGVLLEVSTCAYKTKNVIAVGVILL